MANIQACSRPKSSKGDINNAADLKKPQHFPQLDSRIPEQGR